MWDRLVSLPAPVFLVAVSILVVARSGISPMPNLVKQAQMLPDPFQNPYPTEHSYIWWNWLSPFLAHSLGIRSGSAYLFFCGMIALAILPACYLALRALNLPGPEARWRMLLVCCLPASFTALFWVGMDALTILLLVLVVALRGRLLASAAVGLLCGLQHAEQSLVAIGLLLLANLLLDREAVRGSATALVGVVVGKAALLVIAAHAGGAPLQTRLDYYLPRRGEFFHQFASHAPLVVWSIFGAGWLVFLAAGLGRRALLLLATSAVAGLGLAITADDQTRVAAITTLPALLVLFSTSEFSIARLKHRLVVPLALLLPAIWVWKGHNDAPLPYASFFN